MFLIYIFQTKTKSDFGVSQNPICLRSEVFCVRRRLFLFVLQRRLVGDPAEHDAEVPVAAAQRVHELLRLLLILQDDVVPEFIERAHVCGLHPGQFPLLRVLLHEVIEEFIVVEVFRDRDPQLTHFRRFIAKADQGQDDDRNGHDGKEDDGKQQLVHAAGKADRHGDEDAGDLPGRAGHTAEPDERERSRDRHTGADVAVDQHDDQRDGRRHDGERDGHGCCVFRFELEDQCRPDAQRQSSADAGQEGRDRHIEQLVGIGDAIQHW